MRYLALFLSIGLTFASATAFAKRSADCPEPPCVTDCPEPPCVVVDPEGIPPGISKGEVEKCLKTSIHPSGDVEKNPLLACLKEACAKSDSADDREACMKGSDTFVVNLKDDGGKFEGGNKYSVGQSALRKFSAGAARGAVADDDRKVDADGRLKPSTGAIVPVMMPNGTPPIPVPMPVSIPK
jgi:hypothetical protein